MTERYYFLFGLALIWLVFAVVQDLKKREVANWLNFSLIAFGITYKIFYSLSDGMWNRVWFGILGFGIFVGLAYGFYYSKVFAGGDAKLLMGIGAVLPFSSYWDFAFIGGGFLFLLFFSGALWTLGYSVWVVGKNRERFKRNFADELGGKKLVMLIVILLAMLSWVWFSFGEGILVIIGVILLMFLFVYVKAVDRCMIKLAGADKLTEGDWLERDVKLSRGVIKKSVHGLSWEEIRKIKSEGKRVAIKEGVPFVPAFLFAFGIMVYALEVLGFRLAELMALFL